MSSTREYDLLVVGGGFRAVTFLASSPELVPFDVAVVESSDELGPGAFREYMIKSSSSGSGFFRFLHAENDFTEVLRDPVVQAVACADQPVPLQNVAHALGRLGERLRDVLGEENIHLRRRIRSIDVSSRRPFPILARTDDGDAFSANACILATGRHERLCEVLSPWRNKVWLSGDVINVRRRRDLAAYIMAKPCGNIAIIGGSHSAFSALGVIVNIIDELVQAGTGYCPPLITILHRSPIRLLYASFEEACREYVPGRDEIPDPSRDVCPKTGIVFRDSGLRHETRALYCAVWEQRLPYVTLRRVPNLAAGLNILGAADLIIQATGYVGMTPEIWLDGSSVREPMAPSRLEADDDGRVLIAGTANDYLSALRVEPTPRARRDNSAYAGDLYARLAKRLRAHL